MVISAGTDSGARSCGQQPDRVQGVGDAQFVGREGGCRAGRARIAEAGQGVRGGGAALRVTVVEEEDECLEGPPVPREPQPEGGQLPGPQRLSGGDEDIGQLVDVAGGHQVVVRLRGVRSGLGP